MSKHGLCQFISVVRTIPNDKAVGGRTAAAVIKFTLELRQLGSDSIVPIALCGARTSNKSSQALRRGAGGHWSSEQPSMQLPKNSFDLLSAKHRPGRKFHSTSLRRRAYTGRAAGWFAFPQNNTHFTGAESIASRRSLHAQLIKTALPRLQTPETLRQSRNWQLNANNTSRYSLRLRLIEVGINIGRQGRAFERTLPRDRLYGPGNNST
ncbi:hypothetical protein MRX96_031521 [Rhipicephalus microplus]